MEPFIYLKEHEGWVINTLYAKIAHSTRVWKGLRYGKVFDKHKEFHHEVKLGDEDVGREHWVGSLGHLVSMVGLEGEEGLEGAGGSGAANVRLEEGTEVKLYAVGEDTPPIDPRLTSALHQSDNMDWAPSSPVGARVPAIRAGEMFILGRDGVMAGVTERMQM